MLPNGADGPLTSNGVRAQGPMLQSSSENSPHNTSMTDCGRHVASQHEHILSGTVAGAIVGTQRASHRCQSSSRCCRCCCRQSIRCSRRHTPRSPHCCSIHHCSRGSSPPRLHIHQLYSHQTCGILGTSLAADRCTLLERVMGACPIVSTKPSGLSPSLSGAPGGQAARSGISQVHASAAIPKASC